MDYDYTRDEWKIIIDSCVKKTQAHEQIAGNPERLYTITTISPAPRYGGTRTVAICTFDKANEIVKCNYGDIYELSYTLVVLEAVIPNILYGGHTMEQYWYMWNDRAEFDGDYIPIEIPGNFKHVIAFGIG